MITETTIELDLTEEEYKQVQEILSAISMTLDDAVTYFFKALVAKEKEILSRFRSGEPAEQIVEEVSKDAVRKLFGERNG